MIGISRLRRGDRYWGRRNDWYDGVAESFGFWFFHIYDVEA